ncbi:MAG TPA: EpsI family protein [Bryobacteraceae bacterium]|jgi:EpsI family protein|nr:EpsI family protein [Bryobacteraceae bacterium]
MSQLNFLKSRSAIVLTGLLVVQCAFFYGFSRGEATPAYKPLDGFPTQVGGWRMVQQGVMEQEVKEVLRADDYITRDYAASPTKNADLFVAFFKSQRAGQTPHSPKNCLPGSGWVWTVSDIIPVSVPGREGPIEINRYIVSKGEDRSVVLYWYQSRDRVVASEYKAATFVALDALRYNRTDTALVRVVVPIMKGQQDAATQTGVEFIQAFFSTLRQFFPA